MKAKLLDGKALSLQKRNDLQTIVADLKTATKKSPGLAVLLVGEDPASQVYVRSKGRACDKAGIRSLTKRLPADISEADLLAEVTALNNDPEWHGILVQLPLPKQIDSQKIIEAIAPEKDVDCFHPFNVGRLMLGMAIFEPCTPAGIMQILQANNIETEGKHVVVLGRSNIVGKPIANMLVQKSQFANALVTVVHSRAKDISEYTRQADILIAAIGQPEFVTAEMVKADVTIIDVGINRIDADNDKGYRLVGDVAFEGVSEKAAFITPVPGGVGPMTIAMLLENTVKAFKQQVGS